MALLVHVSDTLCINPTSPLKSCSLLQYSVMTGFIQNNSSQTLLETQVSGQKTHTKWHSTLLSTRYTESSKASEIIQVSLHTSAFLPLSQLVIKITIPWCVSCLRDKTDGVVLTYTSLHCEEQWPRLPSTTERNDHGSDRHKQYCRPQDSGKRSLDLIWGLQRLWDVSNCKAYKTTTFSLSLTNNLNTAHLQNSSYSRLNSSVCQHWIFLIAFTQMHSASISIKTHGICFSFKLSH